MIRDSKTRSTNKTKVWVQNIIHSSNESDRVDIKMLVDAGFEIVAKPADADFGVVFHAYAFSTTYSPLPPSRVIFAYDEPPIMIHVPHYKNRAPFHSWFSLIPLPGDNVFPFTDDPVVFPYPPMTEWDQLREDTTLRRRGVFFRGTVRKEEKMRFGQYYCLYQTRANLMIDLAKFGTPTDVMGPGWPGHNTRYLDIWPVAKRWDLTKTEADFVLAVENSPIPNYITEKIHDAFASDRVVLYLGCPDIEQYVPEGAFVDLRQYYSPKTKKVDARAVYELLQGMTQEEYDRILHTARRWRATDLLEERAVDARARFTRKVIARLTGDPAGVPRFSPTPRG